jgi:formylglycine-generating enzyme required for sulfatase activity
VNEWVLDARNGQLPPGDCVDCAYLLDASGWRESRSGTFETSAVNLQVAKVGFGSSDYRNHGAGIRCARSPSPERSE